MGGKSREREISLQSGQAMLASLQRQGYNANALEAGDDLAAELLESKPDAVLIALHGRYGEDGSVQGMLEMMGIPYSGSGVLPSAICMDKALTKDLLTPIGIPVPEACLVSAIEEIATACAEEPISYPVVVKPNREGSTLGIYLVAEAAELEAAVAKSLDFDDTVLIERYIKGTEVTVGVLNGRPLPVLEVVPKTGFYDYAAKYTKGQTDYIIPARIPEPVAHQIQQQSEMIFHHLNLSGVVRIDFIIESGGEASGQPVFLEVNTIPGMTETSLIPKAAEHAGISFDQVVEAMLESVALKL